MRSRAAIKSHPLHPMLVSLPIGLWVGSFVFDLIGLGFGNASWEHPSFFAAGFYCAIAGCVGAALAAVPGVIDLYSVVPPQSSARSRGMLHGSLNTLALVTFIAVAVLRGSPATRPNGLPILLSLAGIILIAISGWLGGTLAYRNQIGVDRRYANAGQLKERSVADGTRPLLNASELGEGQLMLAKVGAKQVRIALGKCPDGVAAFHDRCTHRGGPLSDGALVGCKVQCPWHGSQFDVHTGRVVAGPAKQQIKVYATETKGGEVYLKDKLPGEQKKAA